MAEFSVLIPARFASTRLPGKPLLLLDGKPMIQHVYDRACASGAKSVYVATDDQQIRQACHEFGAEVVMTASSHTCGTERLAEACRYLQLAQETIVVNVQGDEPLIPPAIIGQVATLLMQDPGAQMATLSHPITAIEDIFNPNIVKVVADNTGRAMYFSRAPIPWDRERFAAQAPPAQLKFYHRHIGIYAYRAGFLPRYVAMTPAPQERCESLEQLRAMYHGIPILIATAIETPGPGIDTAADLEQVRHCIAAANTQKTSPGKNE